LKKHQNKDWKILMKNFRVVSVSAMMAAFAATSVWAAAGSPRERREQCPRSLLWQEGDAIGINSTNKIF
jgi:hypothetical protein